MAVFKCKMCGGMLRLVDGQHIGECDSCGTLQTIPRKNDERIADLYDRANHFRRNYDYDKALELFEQILNEDKEDSEAYWSIVLCRYGIEYVEDPKTRQMVPTVNRAQFASILADEDYKAAIKYADSYRRGIYERDANTIESIHREILEIVNKEEPYDVFICYKDKDEFGNPTYDRTIAMELYNRLTKDGLKTFFAHVSLDNKLGQKYEPYIFAALQSAKVMLVLGTKLEYFNAVWVKNEWKRYYALIKGGAKKTQIALYQNIDVYDLPDELSLQGQDMSKAGWIENLVYVVHREVERHSEETKGNTGNGAGGTITIKGADDNIQNQIRLAFMYLEDCDWRYAKMYFDKLLEHDAGCGITYVGKLLVDLQLKNIDMLGGCEEPFDNNVNYRRAIQFTDGNLKQTLEKSLKQVKYRIANRHLSNGNYLEAAGHFEAISDYKDSLRKGRLCRGYVETKKQEETLVKRIEEIEKEIPKYKGEIKEENKEKIASFCSTLYLIVSFYMVYLIFWFVDHADVWRQLIGGDIGIIITESTLICGVICVAIMIVLLFAVLVLLGGGLLIIPIIWFSLWVFIVGSGPIGGFVVFLAGRTQKGREKNKKELHNARADVLKYQKELEQCRNTLQVFLDSLKAQENI